MLPFGIFSDLDQISHWNINSYLLIKSKEKEKNLVMKREKNHLSVVAHIN